MKAVRLRQAISEALLDLLKSPWMWACVVVVVLQPVLHPLLVYGYLRSIISLTTEVLPITAAALFAGLALFGWFLFFRDVVRTVRARRRGELRKVNHKWIAVAHISTILVIAPAIALVLSDGMRDIGRDGHVVTREAQLDRMIGQNAVQFAQRMWHSD